MLAVPVAIVIVVLHLVFGDQRAAHVAAHEVCPEARLTEAGDGFRFGCEGQSYTVQCDRGDCAVRPG